MSSEKPRTLLQACIVSMVIILDQRVVSYTCKHVSCNDYGKYGDSLVKYCLVEKVLLLLLYKLYRSCKSLKRR